MAMSRAQFSVERPPLLILTLLGIAHISVNGFDDTFPLPTTTANSHNSGSVAFCFYLKKGMAMGSLVFELRADACDDNVNILSLLRKARVVSALLKVQTISAWLEHEMEGYELLDDIPDYRKITGRVIYRHPRHGSIPVDVGHAELQGLMSQMAMNNPLSQLQEFTTEPNRGRTLGLAFGPEQCNELRSLLQTPTSEFMLEIPLNLIDRIVSSVRNRIVDFAVELEAQGILGEDATFTREEKLVASQNNYNITIGTMNGSQIQQATNGSTQTYNQTTDLEGLSTFVESLLPVIGQLNSSVEREQLRSDLETVRSQITAPTPRFGIIRESLHSVRTILEGAAGNVLAAQYLPLLAPLLAGLPLS